MKLSQIQLISAILVEIDRQHNGLNLTREHFAPVNNAAIEAANGIIAALKDVEIAPEDQGTRSKTADTDE
ncbi:hypothetical protein [Ferrimonas marina]|uniref:Uncharacterized protein n=1 Tax=Ferrimonas marina TaxID=299255 RepID=A0A1M5U347_9GAMM|nr:hypothetical protein [Ferrimonas marina]SHH57378.1 hypothetical protein SAMN02745129_2386 [Ferrimonas marina]